jgi:glycosyl transferase family 25
MSQDKSTRTPSAFNFPVYVIHAAHFVERKKHITQALNEQGIDFEFVEAFDPKDITEDVERNYFAPDVQMSMGAKSCALKHVHVMEMMRDRQQRLALVLEDDLVLDKDFVPWVHAFLKEATDFVEGYSIQLGCANNMYVPGRQLRKNQHLYLQKEVRAGEAYLIDAQAANQRLEWIYKNKISLPIDHLFNLSDRQLGLSIYWSDPTLVEQGSMNGLFKTSLDTGRINKSALRLKFKFAWQRLRKKYIYRWFI